MVCLIKLRISSYGVEFTAKTFRRNLTKKKISENSKLKQSSNLEWIQGLQLSNLPRKILCRVLNIRLLVEHDSEEIYAETILLPNQEQNEPTTPESYPLEPPRPQYQSFCKVLTTSDIKSNWGLSLHRKDANKCFPPLDMMQEKPTQELIVNDLQGSEWRFKHVYQGNSSSLMPTSEAFVHKWLEYIRY
ncbi:hypothetical protein K7X08_030168 [Anisodus acutangulus]|uniref:TF-B3 domain-containing protein n=1 Tax=Anisodus acutangulus TaxID=402998 RepID=A0A9Q1R4V3_9SOLA|nr:hypothetical protein K7X08_030168 [Anisodus acutangulus]